MGRLNSHGWWMRRAGQRLAVRLVLGALTAALVAWGCALWGPLRESAVWDSAIVADRSLWFCEERVGLGDPPGGRGALRQFVSWAAVTGTEVLPVRGGDLDDGPGVVRRRVRERETWLERSAAPPVQYLWIDDVSGWPMQALTYEVRMRGTNSGGGWTVEHVGWGLAVVERQSMNLGAGRLWALPVRPVWRGLAVNTGAYALAWAGLLLVRGWARRVRRRRRGWCIECGYDLHGLASRAACPECGRGGHASPRPCEF